MLTCGKDLSLGKGANQSVMTDKTLASTNAKRKSILDMDVLTVLSMANFLVAGSPCKKSFWKALIPELGELGKAELSHLFSELRIPSILEILELFFGVFFVWTLKTRTFLKFLFHFY